jgi:hypothetical protein
MREVALTRECGIHPETQILIFFLIREHHLIIRIIGVGDGELHLRQLGNRAFSISAGTMKPYTSAFGCTESNTPSTSPFTNGIERGLQ